MRIRIIALNLFFTLISCNHKTELDSTNEKILLEKELENGKN
ncbi:hypothetical protein IQ05_00114 [Flavobacterium tiangeerense]|uniref:Lipoprotein n=1 Tax=Flavobacterium tiangeerense TaxID=459471 RepID=A0ABY3FNN2_9FLAO|nr:hypothetical protein IQ05_00114 [Flavobacterium tiangeerense]